MKVGYILCALGALLCASFFDSLRGPLLPVFSHELSLPYDQVSFFLVVGYLASMSLGRALIPLVRRFSSRRVGAVLCLATPLLAGFAFAVNGLGTLIVFGVLVACIASAVGAISNLYMLEGTPPAQRSRFYGLLHTMYGVGSQLAPLALAMFVTRGWGWRWLLVLGSLATSTLGCVIWVSLRDRKRKPPVAVPPARPFHLFSIQGLVVLIFALYVAGEVLTSMWMVTYLVEVKDMVLADAATLATGFFFFMAVSRLACLFVRGEKVEAWFIFVALLFAIGGCALGLSGSPFGFALVGMVGPFFPLMLARLSRTFPMSATDLTLRIMLTIQGTLAVCHFVAGRASVMFGVAMAYHLPIAAFVLALVALAFYFRWESVHRSGVESGG